jgi:mRNA-degrading endonuclease RelE of RelBE toxin-antitoxin system
MVFKETKVFTRQIEKLLPDDEYKELQNELIFNPAAGSIIQRSGGLRKLRWRSATGGKRGGIRVIYYWYVSDDEIFLLLAYGKKQKDDLSAKELKLLRGIVKEEML